MTGEYLSALAVRVDQERIIWQQCQVVQGHRRRAALERCMLPQVYLGKKQRKFENHMLAVDKLLRKFTG